MLTRAWPQTLRWRVYALVGGLLLLLLVTAAATTAARLYATSVGDHVRGTLRPAQQSAAALSKDYVDMETGVRGFLLTRDEQFLAPFESGQADVLRRETDLRQLLAFDEPSLRLLLAVDEARAGWLDASITPSLAAARSGAPMSNALLGREAFDVVRTRLADLQSHIDELTAAGLQRSTAAQNAANSVTIGCAVFALLIGLVTVLLLRTSLDGPLRRLLDQVRWVADGDLGRRVDADGPQEVAELGRAVESMRVRIVGEMGRASEAADQVVRLEETDRIARELGDTVIKNLFGIGLALQSAIDRYPVAQPVFRRAIADLDQAVNQLRSALYGHLPSPVGPSLGLAVQTLVSELESGAGVVPELVLTGDLDHELPDEVAAGVLGVLEEALSVLLEPGGPVEIELARAGGAVRLRITGPVSAAPEALRALEERGGRVDRDGDRVVVGWEAPDTTEPAP